MTKDASLSNHQMLGTPKLLAKKHGIKQVVANCLKLVNTLMNSNSKKSELQQREIEKYSFLLNNAFPLSSGSINLEIQAEIVSQMINQQFFHHCIIAYIYLPFETKKHVRNLFEISALHCSVDDHLMEEFARKIRESIDVIISQIIQQNNENVGMHLHSMLNVCIKYYQTCSVVANSKLFMEITKNLYSPLFTLKNNAFTTLTNFLTNDFDFIKQWTTANYDRLHMVVTDLLTKNNEFIDKLQLLQFLKSVLKVNAEFRERFQTDMETYKQIISIFASNKKQKAIYETLLLIECYFNQPEALYYLKKNYDTHIHDAILKNHNSPKEYIDKLQNSFRKHAKSLEMLDNPKKSDAD